MADDSKTSIEIVPIGSLTPDAANVRKRDDRAKKTLAASLKQFGPARSIVLDGKGIVRAGNGTIEAAQAAGCTEVLVVRPAPGQLVAVRRDDWSATEATAYGISDNRTQDLSAFDPEALNLTLESLGLDGFDLDAIGFTADEVAALIGGGDEPAGETVDDPAGEWKGMPEFEHEDLTPLQSIHVHFASRDDVRAFAELVGQVITEKTKTLWYPEQEVIGNGQEE